jgi:hypothetical protein
MRHLRSFVLLGRLCGAGLTYIPQSRETFAELCALRKTLRSGDDFYKYFSLEGLHLCESFIENITQVPVENFYYDFYRSQAQEFSKDCQ